MTIVLFVLDNTSPTMSLYFPHGKHFEYTNASSPHTSRIKYTRFHAAIHSVQSIVNEFSSRKEEINFALFPTSEAETAEGFLGL